MPSIPSTARPTAPPRSAENQSPDPDPATTGLSASDIAGRVYDRAYAGWLIGRTGARPCERCDADPAGLSLDAEGHCPLEHHVSARLATWILCGLTDGPLEGEVASEFLDAVSGVLRERVRLHEASLAWPVGLWVQSAVVA